MKGEKGPKEKRFYDGMERSRKVRKEVRKGAPSINKDTVVMRNVPFS